MSIELIQGRNSQVTLVFLHGYLLSNAQWNKLALKRAPWRSVLLELPFHGQNIGVSPKERSIISYAEYVKQELDSVGIGKYHLVGHSMGGYIGLELLALDERMQKLILLHSNVWEDTNVRKQNRERVAKIVKNNKPLFLNESVPMLFKDRFKYASAISECISIAKTMTAEGIAHGALAMRDRLDKIEEVRANQQRCYFIQGSHDALISEDEAKKTWEICGEPQHFLVIPDCGHMSHFERPRTLKRVLESIVV
jgi:pimeloyl-ACP methyl ester carboxylesterase